ncbi:MAG TPA: fasciclin domain-containing protein [Actinomycetota bacterium]|jgi:uncharacterized surface protein with fasciclin (FAS1) repeats
MRSRKLITALAAVASLSVVAAACSSDDTSSTDAMDGAESAAPAETTETITDVVAGNEDFSTLLAAVEAAGLGETLAGEGPFTVFAPTDEAFAALPEGTLETLLKPKNEELLSSILTYHVVPAEVMAADVESGEVTTVNGATFTVDASDMGVSITDGQGNEVDVVTTDIVTSNGVIHVIDGVVLPPQE